MSSSKDGKIGKFDFFVLIVMLGLKFRTILLLNEYFDICKFGREFRILVSFCNSMQYQLIKMKVMEPLPEKLK